MRRRYAAALAAGAVLAVTACGGLSTSSAIQPGLEVGSVQENEVRVEVNPVAVFTAVGRCRSVTVLSPNWPRQLPPQQYARPAVVTAHEYSEPTATLATLVAVSPVVVSTGVGVHRSVVVLSPISPRLFPPQQYA